MSTTDMPSIDAEIDWLEGRLKAEATNATLTQSARMDLLVSRYVMALHERDLHQKGMTIVYLEVDETAPHETITTEVPHGVFEVRPSPFRHVNEGTADGFFSYDLDPNRRMWTYAMDREGKIALVGESYCGSNNNTSEPFMLPTSDHGLIEHHVRFPSSESLTQG